MPNIGVLHPQVVHFAIALLLVGVLLRVASLALNKWTWLTPAATTLLLLGTVAAAVSVKSGDDAHGPVERIPGVRNAVEEHEEWGERARNVFFGVTALELVALALASERRRGVYALSALVGLGGAFAVYEAGEHGGELVYAYAGGVGIRSGEPADVSRLYMAGLYQQAMLDRKDGRGASAAGIVDEMRRRFPNDTAVRMLAIESLLRDRGDAPSALAALDSVAIPADNRRLRSQAGTLRADALLALARRDEARTVLQELLQAFPGNPRIQAKLDSIR